MKLYSQCQQPWRDKVYSSTGNATFCKAGCLVTSLSSLATCAGYDIDPLTFVKKIDEAGAFSGNYLSYPEKVTKAFPNLVWRRAISWATVPANLTTLKDLLAKNPTVLRVDYEGSTPEIDEHYVLGLEYKPDPTGGPEDDLRIVDPLVGRKTSILTYFEPKWNYESKVQSGAITRVQRIVMGARVWEVANPTSPTSSIRGVHGSCIKALPQDPPGNGDWWIAEMKAMRLKWFKTMSLNPDWCRKLIAAGITPIVRLHQHQQFPARLDSAQFDMARLLIQAGVRYFEIGNEPNLPNEWRPAYQPFVSWQNPHLVALVVENWWLDAQEIISLGGKVAFYALAPTDRDGVHPTCSSVMWMKKLIQQLGNEHGTEIKQLVEEGKVWLAVHISPFSRPFDFEPNRGSYIDDMCLRGYEPTLDLWKQAFGCEPEVISTEGGVFSPKHMRDLQWEPNYTDETWGAREVEMFTWLEQNGKLTAMCSWFLSDSQLSPDHTFCGCGWYGPNGEPRSPVEAMKA